MQLAYENANEVEWAGGRTRARTPKGVKNSHGFGLEFRSRPQARLREQGVLYHPSADLSR